MHCYTIQNSSWTLSEPLAFILRKIGSKYALLHYLEFIMDSVGDTRSLGESGQGVRLA